MTCTDEIFGKRNPPGAVVDEEQHEPTPQEDRIDVEQIGGYDRGCLGFEKGGPGEVHTLRRWVDPCLLQNGPDGGGRDLAAQAEELSVDAAVSPSRVLPCQTHDQLPQGLWFRWSTRTMGE
ncbi:hypothetical protein [Streptomyces sp. GMR22]|uniref:hypothetical protein n=1 Tax=Streptomyces sp. GMR22 TaxID=2759524 RepID=UPI0018EFB862|nr:hypothetical protein [Streptomyces sp. GMR22]